MPETVGKSLIVLMAGRRVGVLTQADNGRLALEYDEDWRFARNATPLSLSMPLARRIHEDPVVRPVLWGLLPDNERVLERWARDYQISAGNPFALLQHVGEDCASGAQFVEPGRVESIVNGEGGVQWLDEAHLAERLRVLRADPTSWHVHNSGQFSLAGAQAKTALYFDPVARRWGEPWGSTPTTHILKPAVAGLDEHDLNEHLCLSAAGLAGLLVARSSVVTFEDERAIEVERYDRRYQSETGLVQRLHQEDLCQALGVSPANKYQSDGGPSPEHIIDLLRREVHPKRVADAHIARFVDALAFNWIIAGTDAHAKNYSLLLSGGQVRLAPLYDVASALAYNDMYLPKLQMAMRIGGEYRIEGISDRHWRRFAETNRLDPEETITRIDTLAARTPGCFEQAAQDGTVLALESKLSARLVERVRARALWCRRALKQDR
ncbi:type II toxin-antitoxin system HipA family toxin [Dactylosporangium sp. NPDC005555]|uniref:type II toxin-antitoxin system HipA family toxin n=1 Tax=Dactylosporangium sp. NPDC005555 TaxID=3154889 RepID=UPI0033AF6FEA